ncbi:MAG: hypothetical protein Kow0062_06320 [Acidobacteriota bacterium]
MTKSSSQTIVALVVAALAIGPVAPTLAAPTPAPAVLEGRVLSPDLSEPMPDLAVSAIPEGAKEPVARAATDEKGRFAFEGLAAGRYILLLESAPGTPVAAAPVEALAGKRQRITLALPAVAPAQAGGKGGFGAWVSTPVGATITAVVSAIIVGVLVDSALGDDEEQQDLSPVAPPSNGGNPS